LRVRGMFARESADGDCACSCEKPTARDQSVRNDCTPEETQSPSAPPSSMQIIH
jgi:hypothetical protein